MLNVTMTSIITLKGNVSKKWTHIFCVNGDSPMSPLATREVKNEGVRLDLVAEDPAPVEFEDVILQEDDRAIVRSTRRINERVRGHV